MNQSALRKMIQNSIQRHVRICMDDGAKYEVSHPDFAMITPDAVVLAAGSGHDLGGLSFVICWLDNISRVEVREKPRQKSGKG
jgi:hypothetical protein